MPLTSHAAPRTLARPRFWGDDAACKDCDDPDTFFPVSYEGVNQFMVDMAKSICARCPVIDDCLHGALERNEPDGVWGGLDPNERRVVLGDRRRAAGGRESPDAAEEEEAPAA